MQRFQTAPIVSSCIFRSGGAGMPAILKGWFDRVLAYGFAYADGQRYDSGYFRGRGGLLCVTTGGTTGALLAERRLRRDRAGALAGASLHDRVSRAGGRSSRSSPMAAPRVDDAARQDYLRAWEARLREIAAQPALERV